MRVLNQLQVTAASADLTGSPPRVAPHPPRRHRTVPEFSLVVPVHIAITVLVDLLSAAVAVGAFA